MKRLIKWLLRLIVAGIAMILLGNTWVIARSSAAVHKDLARLPVSEVGVVLGTSPRTRKGNPNEHFASRMDAAAALYKAGKIQHVLVSGDNRADSYNEPVYMRKALVKRGVPKTAITLDYAGIRTLDSVVRANKVFGLKRYTIISQCYHNYRAVYLANTLTDAEVMAWCSPQVSPSFRWNATSREWLARMKALLDIHVLGKKPRFLGKEQPIFVDKR